MGANSSVNINKQDSEAITNIVNKQINDISYKMDSSNNSSQNITIQVKGNISKDCDLDLEQNMKVKDVYLLSYISQQSQKVANDITEALESKVADIVKQNLGPSFLDINSSADITNITQKVVKNVRNDLESHLSQSYSISADHSQNITLIVGGDLNSSKCKFLQNMDVSSIVNSTSNVIQSSIANNKTLTTEKQDIENKTDQTASWTVFLVVLAIIIGIVIIIYIIYRFARPNQRRRRPSPSPYNSPYGRQPYRQPYPPLSPYVARPASPYVVQPTSPVAQPASARYVLQPQPQPQPQPLSSPQSQSVQQLALPRPSPQSQPLSSQQRI